MASVGHFIVIYFLQGFVVGEPQQNTLNVANVLLPYVPRGSVHTNFTLRALQGCYMWYVFLALEADSGSRHFAHLFAVEKLSIFYLFIPGCQTDPKLPLSSLYLVARKKNLVSNF